MPLQPSRPLRGAWSGLFAAALVAGFPGGATAAPYHRVSYPPSTAPGELPLAVDFTLWLPPDAGPLRAILVHQHGCGFAANAAGETAAYDLHWQALARKWRAAVLAPRYHQVAQGREGCEPWSDPRLGSRAVLLRALDDLAERTGRAELRTAPWCLWGHSGGAYWVSLMQTLDPERIVAAWLRSGTAYPRWAAGEIPPPVVGQVTLGIPTMLNPGIKESLDGRPTAAWLGSVAMFEHYRAAGAAIAFAADPLSGHDCGNSRYLAIPFFDACLKLRLPPDLPATQDTARDHGPPTLRPIDTTAGYRAELLGRDVWPAAEYRGPQKSAVWLPDGPFARAWAEYVATGLVSDATPPPAPTTVRAARHADGSITLTWEAIADLESGLAGFVIERGGSPIARLPDGPAAKDGRPAFQAVSFHDTPEPPLPETRFVDPRPGTARPGDYGVRAVNGAGLSSEAAPATAH